MKKEGSRLSKKEASFLCSIYYLTKRDRSFPDRDTLMAFTGLSLAQISYRKEKLIEAHLIEVEKGHNPVFMPVLNTPKNRTEPWKFSEKMIDIILAVYAYCNEKDALPDIKTIISMTGFSKTTTYSLLSQLKDLGIVNLKWEIQFFVEPVHGSPISDSEKPSPDSERISELHALLIQTVYNLTHELGRAPDAKMLTERSGIVSSTINTLTMALEKEGILYRDKAEKVFTFYILQGNGCDDIAAPKEAIHYNRLSKNDADILCLIFHFNRKLKCKPTISDMIEHFADGTNRSYFAQPLARLEQLSLISYSGKYPKKYTVDLKVAKSKKIVSTVEVIKDDLRLTANQASALNFIRHHTLTYGYSPSIRDIAKVIGGKEGYIYTLVQKGLLYLDETTKNGKARIMRGFGMDDVPTELPFLNETHYLIFDAIIDAIRANTGDLTLSVSDITEITRRGCFATITDVAERVEMTPDEVKKYLFALRVKGCLFESRKNRYGLSAEYITVAKDIVAVDDI